jgi:hypothetical protein
MKKLALLTVALCVFVPAAVVADWSDGFENYIVGQGLHGQDGWAGWDNDATVHGMVVNSPVYQGEKAFEVAVRDNYTDMVHQYTGVNNFTPVYTAMQYIPEGLAGTSYFILLDTYTVGGDPKHWNVQIAFNDVSAPGMVLDTWTNPNHPTLPIIYDQWVEIRVEIDMVNDACNIFYGGALLTSGTWTIDDAGTLNLAAVDLYTGDASPVYYDNLCLTPEPGLISIVGLAGLGALGMLRKRR